MSREAAIPPYFASQLRDATEVLAHGLRVSGWSLATASSWDCKSLVCFSVSFGWICDTILMKLSWCSALDFPEERISNVLECIACQWVLSWSLFKVKPRPLSWSRTTSRSGHQSSSPKGVVIDIQRTPNTTSWTIQGSTLLLSARHLYHSVHPGCRL